MSSLSHLNRDEHLVLDKLNRYFKSNHMSTKEKARAARLIAEHELESHAYSNEKERQAILFFYQTLGKLMEKL